MTQKNAADPAGLFSLSKDWLAAQQNFLPTGRIYTQFAEAMRTITQAQITYGQTVMRANAALLASLMEAPGQAEEPDGAAARAERPSRAAHRPDMSAP
ncbi:MAG: hypothetical protein KGJ73_02765 [Rhodospirillales bacterium]|nr:hypothetical protein [Rhodospirillales bacterium]